MDLFKPRYLEDPIREDLENKMVFVGGPRQVGKTTLARRIADNWTNTAYFNWDKSTHRQAILHEQWPPETRVIVFDEIHKLLQAEIKSTAVHPGDAGGGRRL